MINFSTTIYANENSIANEIGSTPAIVTFKNTLNPGDTISITVPVTSTWSYGANSETNADGTPIKIGPPLVIHWDQLNPVTPPKEMVKSTPNAINYSFGVGCLIGSLDSGNSFFPVGTNFKMTVLSKNISALWLYNWDGYSPDNSGSINATVTVDTPS